MDNRSSLIINQGFGSMNEAREAVLADAVASGLSFKVDRSEPTRFLATCMVKDKTNCPFSIRIGFKRKEAVIRSLIQYSCDFTDHDTWKRANNARLVARRYNTMIKSDLTIKPSQIQNIDRLQCSRKTPYLQAWRARQSVRKDTFMNKKQSYQLINPFLNAITDRDIDTDTDLDPDGNWAMTRANASISVDSNNQFDWCFIAPRACVTAFWNSRRFICLDGAHMKDERELILLILTTLDSNENVLPLIWGYAKSESLDSWIHFLTGFKEHFLDTITDDVRRESFQHLICVSDRGKGLVPAVTQVLPKAHHYHCTQHLAANVGNEFGKEIEKLFRAACQVESPRQFKVHLDKIEGLSAQACQYVDQISARHYAFSAAPLVDFPCYGQTCLNIAESINSV